MSAYQGLDDETVESEPSQPQLYPRDEQYESKAAVVEPFNIQESTEVDIIEETIEEDFGTKVDMRAVLDESTEEESKQDGFFDVNQSRLSRIEGAPSMSMTSYLFTLAQMIETCT